MAASPAEAEAYKQAAAVEPEAAAAEPAETIAAGVSASLHHFYLNTRLLLRMIDRHATERNVCGRRCFRRMIWLGLSQRSLRTE